MRFLIYFALMAIVMESQSQVLSGVVSGVNDKGEKETLVGASVYFSETTIGTFTDVDGSYSLKVPQNVSAVVFSFVGYLSDTISYSGQSVLNVTLNPDQGVIQEAEVETEKSSTELSLIDPINSQVITENELSKAACCNLSESFETNASIDASFTDAVTGTSQIRMLGLDGKYTQIMQDVVPSIRGLYVLQGLSYVPGPWIQSIQISKGVGSVSNGYESMTGQINVSMKNPENAEKLYVNAYGNQGGRTELNAAYNLPVGKRFKTLTSLHAEWNDRRVDMNNDGFMDNPLKKDLILRSAWKYRSLNDGWRGEYQATYLTQERLSGQLDYNNLNESLTSELWGMESNTQYISTYVKTGYVWKNAPARSFGSQISYTNYSMDSNYGQRIYEGFQESARVNLLFSSILGTTDHKFLTGISAKYDHFSEDLDSLNFSRIERVPGVFFEYTWNKGERLSLIGGMRADHHNLFGWFCSPRLHFRYGISENTTVKLVSGRGYRTSNIVMEHAGSLASNRQFSVEGQLSGNMPNLQPEISWNSGANLLSKFRLMYREASLSLDYYYTWFENQVVMDLEDPRQAQFYNLRGESFSHSAQVEFNWTPARRWDLRLAYRWLDVRTDLSTGLLSKPFVNKHRAFANVAYETKEGEKGDKWKFDVTGNWVGSARLPSTLTNPGEFQLQSRSDNYVLVNAQITRVFSESFEVYLGGENLGNFRQPNAIVAAEQPFSEYFDASMVWGPVFGSMAYAGLRWRIE